MKALIQENNTLSRYPAIKVASLPFLPAVLTASTLANSPGAEMASNAESLSLFNNAIRISGVPINACGALVTNGGRSSSLGGILSITLGGERVQYGITVQHLTQLASQCDDDLSNLPNSAELVFDSDDDTENDDQDDDNEEETTSLCGYASLPPLQNTDTDADTIIL